MAAWQLRDRVRSRRTALADGNAEGDAGDGRQDDPLDVASGDDDVPPDADTREGVNDRA